MLAIAAFAAGAILGRPAVVSAEPAAHFIVSVPGTTPTAGEPFSVTVTAVDADDQVIADYDFTGAVVTSSLGDAPNNSESHANGTVGESDGGIATLTGAISYLAQTDATVTVTKDAMTGTSATFTIDPAAVESFTFSTIADISAGGSIPAVTVSAFDAYGNAATNYDFSTAANESNLGDAPNDTADHDDGDLSDAADGTADGTATISEAVGYKTDSGRKLTVTDTSIGVSDDSNSFTILPAALGSFVWTPIGTPVTAGAPAFSIGATAYDLYGNVKTDYTASPALTKPGVSPNNTPSTFPATMSFTAGIGSASGQVFKASAFSAGSYTADQSFKVKQGLIEATSNQIAVESAALSRLDFGPLPVAAPMFSGQPIDTKVASVLYSSCTRAPVGSADPCTTASDPVKVLATDAYGNRKAGVSVGIARQAVAPSTFLGTFTGLQPKTTSGGAAGDPPLGEAWFSNLKISTISGSATDRYTLRATSGTVNGDSSSFRIVSDLANCNGVNKCFNNTKNNSVDKPENSYSQTKTTTGTFGNVFTTTNFADPTLANDVDSRCTSVRTQATIGSAIDVRVVGDVTATKPTSTMVMILPIKTLKFYGLTARNADAYNVCLGAIYLDSDAATSWTGKDKKNKALEATQAPDADGIQRWWGVPADCGQKYLDSKDPCISLKSKSASVVAARMTQVTGETWTVARVNSELNFSDGDIAIFVTKPFPWDGKGGLF